MGREIIIKTGIEDGGRPKGPVMDWRQLADLHLQLDRTGLAPEAEAHLNLMAWWNKLNDDDSDKFKEEASWMQEGGEGNWRWLASIPHNVAAALLQLNPNIFSEKEEFRAWLRTEGKQYLIPGAKL